MNKRGTETQARHLEAQPILGQRGEAIQPFGTLVNYPIGLDEKARAANVAGLNQVLVDTMFLRDLYKKSHWQVTGPTFMQLHMLFDTHFKQQVDLMDMVGERVQTLGGVTLATPHDVAERTKAERPPRDREQVPVQISRLIEVHTLIIEEARKLARISATNGDDGTNNLLVSFVIPQNEKAVWFLSVHLADVEVVRAR